MGKHTHARVGGGKTDHDHDFDPDDGHAHDGLMALPKPMKGAVLDAAARKKISDSSYAYIDSKGGRHFPINDEAHVRAAISRFDQGQFESPEKKATAARKIRGAAKRYGIDIDAGSAVMKASEPTVIALRFKEQTDLAEREIPFLTTGKWHWPDYGDFEVTRDDLAEVYQHFKDNVRQQDLPVLNADHADPSQFPNAAIGWVQDLVMRDPDTLAARVDFNPVGEQLIANDQFRYVSPELLRGYTDAATGKTYRIVAAGLDTSKDNRSMHAVTNFPRIKQLGRIAAGERADCVALRFGEVTSDTPGNALRMKLQEDDWANASGTDPDEMCTAIPCCWAPPYSPVGRCPGFTRAAGLVDGDNDQPGDKAGCCELAVKCNGYVPVGDFDGDSDSGPSVAPSYTTAIYQPMAEGDMRMGEHDENGTQPAGASGGDPDPVPAAAPTPAVPAPSVAAATDAETRNLLKAAENRQAETERRLQAAERRSQELEERLNAAERAKVLDGYRGRLDDLLRSNRITPAVHEKLAASEQLMRFSEDGNDAILAALEQLPGTAIPMSEVGTGNEPQHGEVDNSRLIVRMNEIFAERSPKNTRYTFQDAAKAAAAEVFGPKGGA